jgi:disulfide bond formation protein DsbB
MTSSSRALDRVGARRLYVAVAVASLGLIGAALFMQHVVGLNPCPLCILQRIAFLFLAIASGLAAWRSPRSSTRGFAVAAVLFALTGAGIAAWHVRLKSMPEVLSCGPGLGAMLENFPLTQVLPRILRGSGDCADASAVLFGVSLPAWSLAGFLVLALALIAAIVRR